MRHADRTRRNIRDIIFADSLNSELASVSGNPATGYAATFTVGLTSMSSVAKISWQGSSNENTAA